MGRKSWRGWWAANWERGGPGYGGMVMIATGTVLDLLGAGDTLAGLLIVGGLLLAGLSIFHQRATSFEAGPKGVKVTMNSEERAASAEAAEAERDDGLERRIHSDDTGLPSPSEQDADVVGSLNYVAGSFAVGSIIDHLAVAPALERSQFRVFLYDESADRLLPVFQPDTSIDSQGWAIGTGATGTAYESGEYVVAEGASVTDATHSLTPEQQERYRHLTAVASAPIFNAAGRVIGVLTVSSTRPDHELGSADAEQAITLGALLLSRVLIDLLGWFDDTD